MTNTICQGNEYPYYYFVGNEMVTLIEIFAQNLKEKRHKIGITQAELAEKAGVSTHHIAMIEIARNYPTLELIERIAEVLNIEVYELFLAKPMPENAMKQLHDSLVVDLKKVVGESVKDAMIEQYKNLKK